MDRSWNILLRHSGGLSLTNTLKKTFPVFDTIYSTLVLRIRKKMPKKDKSVSRGKRSRRARFWRRRTVTPGSRTILEVKYLLRQNWDMVWHDERERESSADNGADYIVSMVLPGYATVYHFAKNYVIVHLFSRSTINYIWTVSAELVKVLWFGLVKISRGL